MKRLQEKPAWDDTRDYGPLKRVKRTELFEACERELAFFRGLWPYEQLRWLYACLALCSALPCDIVRTVLVDWMHLQCVSRTCNRRVPALTERAYKEQDGLPLYQAMRQLGRDMMQRKVEGERAALLKQSVPKERLFLVRANYPYSGLGVLMDYTPDWMARDDYWDRDRGDVRLPAYMDYSCVDMEDTASIRLRIDKDVLSDDKLEEWRAKRYTQMLAIVGQRPIESYLTGGK
jgi:hypothetical protein